MASPSTDEGSGEPRSRHVRAFSTPSAMPRLALGTARESASGAPLPSASPRLIQTTTTTTTPRRLSSASSSPLIPVLSGLGTTGGGGGTPQASPRRVSTPRRVENPDEPMCVFCQSIESASAIQPPSYYTQAGYLSSSPRGQPKQGDDGDDDTFLLLHVPSSTSILLANKYHSLRERAVRLTKVVGCCHDTTQSFHQCRICTVITSDSADPHQPKAHHHNGDDLSCGVCKARLTGLVDAFLGPDFISPAIEIERALIAAYVVDHRAMVRDLITLFNWHSQYERDHAINRFFRVAYPLIAGAYDRVNRLPEFELDGRSVSDWSEAGFPMGDGLASSSSSFSSVPRYCSWPYLPDGERAKRVFYISTLLPLEEDFLHYLIRVMNPPQALVEELTRRESDVRHSPRSTADQRLARRLEQVLRLSQPASPREAEDVRDDRAKRSEKMLSPGRALQTPHGPRQLLGASLPRLVIVARDERIQKLEPRRDYVFTADPHFINVFTIALDASGKALSPASNADAGLDGRAVLAPEEEEKW